MLRQIPHTHRAESYEMVVRLFSFLLIGGFGAIVNLLCFSSVYYSLLGVTNSFIAYGTAFIVGTEVSISSNFILNDRFTFGDLHARSWQARCLRYHATSTSGVLLTLHAQATALIFATACNFALHRLFTYGHVAVQSAAKSAEIADTAL